MDIERFMEDPCFGAALVGCASNPRLLTPENVVKQAALIACVAPEMAREAIEDFRKRSEDWAEVRRRIPRNRKVKMSDSDQ